MDEDSELCVLVPLRDFVAFERLPVRPKWSAMSNFVHFLQTPFARAVVFRASLLPFLVEQRGIFCNRWRSRRILATRDRRQTSCSDQHSAAERGVAEPGQSR